jgi:uncharacterized membrane protein YebE (DUF533 family)
MDDIKTRMQSVLDQITAKGKDLYRQGEDMAADRLGVGDDPAARQTMRNTALAGGAAAAVLGLLLGTKSGRSVTRTGVVVGGLGVLGKLAYDAYRKHAGGAQPDAAPVGQLEGPTASDRAATLLVAMIAAAKADGHIDEREKAAIQEKLAKLGPEAQSVLMDEIGKPLDAKAVAALADSDQARREIYAVTALVCRADDPRELSYMAELAGALNLDAAVAKEIEAGVAGA